MKILQLCYKPPLPLVDGGTMAMHSLTKGLLNTANHVTILTFYSAKHPCDISSLPQDYVKATHFESVFVDLRIKALPALWYFITNQSYHVKRFISKAMRKKLISVLKQQSFDVVQVESIFLAPYVETIRANSKAKIVLRAQNIEHLIWARTAKNTKNLFKKIYLYQLAQSLKHFELKSINSFDGICAITNVDAQFFLAHGCNVPCIGLPFGWQKNQDTTNIQEEENTLFHIGSMDWLPNQQGLLWFIDKVWPSLHTQIPLLKLYLAGREMPQSFFTLNKEGIVVLGKVKSSEDFIASKQIMIVPLLAGSGIRIKILEAMNMGKCIIATPQAAEGIECTHGKNIIIASSPTEFVISIIKCAKNKGYREQIGQNAKQLIEEKYSTNLIASCLTSFYNKLI